MVRYSHNIFSGMKMHTELVFWVMFKPDLDERDATELRYTSVWILICGAT